MRLRRLPPVSTSSRAARADRGPSGLPSPLPVNLVGSAPGLGGIPRYTQELVQRLDGAVVYRHCRVGASIPLLRNFPLTVQGLDPSAPLHFSQIVGAGVAWFRRLPPSLVTVHDLGLLRWPAEARMFTLVDRFYLHLSFTALSRMDRLIAISAYTARSLVRDLGVRPERIVLVPQGLDHAIFWPRPRARDALADRWGLGEWATWRTILVVGSELPRKNLRTILHVVAHYQRRGQCVRLIKVGAPGEPRWRDDTLRTIARLGIADRVHLLEDVPDADLALLYSAADAYACPSLLEGQSLPTIEAMACGAPTVVAGAAALPETVADAGLVVESPEDPVAWCTVLDSVFSDSALRATLHQRAIERAAQFDWQRTAEATHAIYVALTMASTTR